MTPQYTYVETSDGVKVDLVIRFENLVDEVAGIGERLNIEKDFPHLNKSGKSRQTLSQVYTDYSLERVYEIYRQDFESFGYEAGFPD